MNISSTRDTCLTLISLVSNKLKFIPVSYLMLILKKVNVFNQQNFHFDHLTPSNAWILQSKIVLNFLHPTAYIFPSRTTRDPWPITPGIIGSADKFWRSSPSSLKEYILYEANQDPPNRSILSTNLAASKFNVLEIFLFRGRIFHYSSLSIWRLSIEFLNLWGSEPPQKQNALKELSRILPGNFLASFREGRSLHLLWVI